MSDYTSPDREAPATRLRKPPPDPVQELIGSINRRLTLIDASVEQVANALLDARIGAEGDDSEDQWQNTLYYARRFIEKLNERLGIEAEASVPAAPHDCVAVEAELMRAEALAAPLTAEALAEILDDENYPLGVRPRQTDHVADPTRVRLLNRILARLPVAPEPQSRSQARRFAAQGTAPASKPGCTCQRPGYHYPHMDFCAANSTKEEG